MLKSLNINRHKDEIIKIAKNKQEEIGGYYNLNTKQEYNLHSEKEINAKAKSNISFQTTESTGFESDKNIPPRLQIFYQKQPIT